MEIIKGDDTLKTISKATVDNKTLHVTSHKGQGLEWNKPLDFGESEVYHRSKEVFSAGQGLKYVLVVEEFSWAEYGEGKFRVSGPIRPEWFDTEEEADEAIKDLEKDGEDPDNIRKDFIPNVSVILSVVPVSVPDGMFSGYEDWQEEARKYKRENGHYAEYYWDIYREGLKIPVWSETDLEPETSILVEEAKKQAVPIPTIFGFYMDRPVNRIGETGWDWLERFGAFPAQHEKHESKEEPEHCRCNTCWEETMCGSYDTVESDDVRICEGCLSSYWIACTKCGKLMPIDPESYDGVEWVELNYEKYCRYCAAEYLDSPEHGYTIPGRARGLKMEEMREKAVNLAWVSLDTWEEVERWSSRWGDSRNRETDIFLSINEIIREAQYNEEFLVGIVGRGQFDSQVGLFKRRKENVDSE